MIFADKFTNCLKLVSHIKLLLISEFGTGKKHIEIENMI